MRILGYFRRKYNENQREKHKLLALVAAAGVEGRTTYDTYTQANGTESDEPLAPTYDRLLELAKEGLLEHFQQPGADKTERYRFRITPQGEAALREGPKEMPAPKLSFMNFQFTGVRA